MGSVNDILNESVDQKYDDWALSALLVSFILMCFVIGLNRLEFKKSIKTLLKLNCKDDNIVYSSLGTFDFLLMMLHVSLTIGVTQFVLFSRNLTDNLDSLWDILISSLIVFLILFFKVNASDLVNRFLYKRKFMRMLPSLWTGFYIQSIFTFASFVSVLSILFYLLDWPVEIGRVLLLIVAIIVEVSIIIKLYNVFLRKKIALLIFFLYLCALEFAPTILAWLLIV